MAQDTLLDREVAFALIKTEGLDDVSRTRITREAQPWAASALILTSSVFTAPRQSTFCLELSKMIAEAPGRSLAWRPTLSPWTNLILRPLLPRVS